MHQEYKYLNLVEKILKEGKDHKNRTGIKTKRLICEVMKFDLSEEFPLITTKKMYWKGIVHELLWFLSGDTSIKYLKDNNVHIWDKNVEDFYQKRILKSIKKNKNYDNISGFYNDEYDYNYAGLIYGYQWRNFNGQGFDQIQNAINLIKNNPDSRRIIVSAWNPSQLNDMCLPPCHVLLQFTVDEGILHSTLFQRSADEFLGIPFNIASYSLLTYMVAHVCGLKPGTFNHVMNDAHIYYNHIDAVKEQLLRVPYPFPNLELNKDIKNIDDFKYEDIQLINYKSHPTIKADMAV